MSRKALVKGAMKKTTSQKKHLSGVLAKLSSVDPQPHRNDPRKRPKTRRYKMYNKKAKRFEYGSSKYY